jgi:hypothetical protein
MNVKEILREQIKTYLIENPIDRTQPNCYVNVAKQFGVDSEYIRSIYKKLRSKGLVEEGTGTVSMGSNYMWIDPKDMPPPPVMISYNEGFQTITTHTKKEVKNELDLAEECDIDLNIWTITNWECKCYQAWIKNKNGEIESEPKYSVYAKMKRRNIDKDIVLQKDALIQEIKEYSPKISFEFKHLETEGLFLISVPDIHFGKLSWREETNEDYDIKIAEDRFKEAIASLVSRVNLKQVSRIVFPIGNDLINIDNIQKTTTAGTPQDTDIRFPKIIKTVRRILVETIDKLSLIAPVDVVIVPGNHDQQTTFLLGEILDAFYSNNKNVTVDNSPKLRKYYKYGKVGIQWTHGDKEKHESLGLIFATEQPQLWADTKYRFCQLGHFHKNKKLNFVSVDEHQGFQVQIIPSLSGTDAWHYGKGYNSAKQAKAFLYDAEQGLIAEYTHTL